MSQSSPRILAIANQKGGVGKTTTTINLGTALAAIGERVLIVDLDPQGNASTGLGVSTRDREITTYDVLRGDADLVDIEKETLVPGLTVAPAGVDLAASEIELINEEGRHQRLRRAIDRAAAKNPDISYVLIDCPPSLGMLTVNAMAAADAVLIPLQCEFFALEGLAQILKSIGQVRQRLNPDLDLQGIVLTMYDRRNNLSREVEENVREYMGEKVYQTAIPRNVRLSEAPSYGKPALLYDLKCPGSQAYVKLASEIIQRERAA